MKVMVTEFPSLGVTALSRWIFNCYIVHDGGAGQPLVIDVGLPSLATEAVSWLKQRRPGVAPVVVATHGHGDHVGGIPKLTEAMPRSVALPERIRAYVEGEKPRSPGPAALAAIAPVFGDQPRSIASIFEMVGAGRKIGYSALSVKFPDPPDQWLADGDDVAGAPAWRIIHTPGHTDDSTTLWNESSGVMFSGDAVLSCGGRAWFTPELVDESLATETEERLRPLPVRALFPGHGRPVVDTDVMAHALSPTERPPVGSSWWSKLGR